MNIEGSFKHILTDLISFIATAIAGAAILTTGWTRADGVAALFVAVVMLWAAYSLLKDSGRVLLEAAPEGLNAEEIGHVIAAHAHVASVHDLHVQQKSRLALLVSMLRDRPPSLSAAPEDDPATCACQKLGPARKSGLEQRKRQ
jgi:Co/Zn/Cd efflux system component